MVIMCEGRFLQICITLLFAGTFVALAADFGPYDLRYSNFRSCSDVVEPKIIVGVKPKKINRNSFSYDINITNSITFDDSFMTTVKTSQLTSRGHYKENFLVKDFTRSCSTWKTFLPGIMKTLSQAMKNITGEDLENCHLLPGSRLIPNVIFREKSLGVLPPVFFYNKYIMKSYLKKKKDIVGCVAANIDVTPKKN